ncbi:hypothetical protein ABGB17_14600 [Sphaerisporangium sp. B11E5]|uniref:hypothetical protein n=1 Tax=Sphaerisporangium sp. B11E5 TaxID=3153563 RepID=UPI00325EB04F
MSDQFSHIVNSPHSQNHMGSGSQHNTFIYATLTDKKGTPFRRYAGGYLRWLLARFVPPLRLGDARELLASQGAVLLYGQPGSGRLAAAQILLYELRSGEDTFDEMQLNNDENGEFLGTEGISDDGLLLLDLSEVDEQLWERAQEKLHSVWAAVRRHRSRMVVVLPYKTAARLTSGLEPIRVEITRPPGREVLWRYLRHDGIPADAIQEPGPDTAEFLDGTPRMEDIAQFAKLVVRAREKAGGKGDLAGWCREAHTALHGREDLVASRLRQLRDGPSRALLLATAMLHGTHADVIHEATAMLLRELKHPGGDVPPLEHKDLNQRFRAIGAERDGQGKVFFKDLGYDAAVRRYIWTHMPDLRTGITDWVGKAARSTGLDKYSRDELVGRFTELCLHERYWEMLVGQVERWTASGPANSAGPRAAAQALTGALQDQRQGWFFRRRIYEWSTRADPSPALAEVIISMCTEVMAVRHPYEAVVRLHHLARRERSTRAHGELAKLVREDRRLMRLMLDRLTFQFNGSNNYRADPGIFLYLADPEVLSDQGNRARSLLAIRFVRDQVTTCWTAVFTKWSEDGWIPSVRRWLLTAGHDGAHRDVLLDILVDAAVHRADIHARLYVMAGEVERSLPTAQEPGARLRDRVVHRIYAVQGVKTA